MNNCVFSGRMVKDPELKFIPSTGMAVTKFSLAVDYGFGDKKKTSFLNMTAFSKTAEAIANYTNKGAKVTLRTHVQTGSYDNKEGVKVYTTDFIVDEIEFPSKKETSNAPNSTSANFDDFENDVFQPVDDSENDIPF